MKVKKEKCEKCEEIISASNIDKHKGICGKMYKIRRKIK